jgi:hypothetical protein
MTAQDADELAVAADTARARLLDTVVRLDERRKGLLEVPKKVGRSMWRSALAAATVAMVAMAALAMHGVATHKTRHRRDRWRLLKTAWSHPDRELRAERRPFATEAMRSLLLTAVTSLLAIPLRRAMHAVETRGNLWLEEGKATPEKV